MMKKGVRVRWDVILAVAVIIMVLLPKVVCSFNTHTREITVSSVDRVVKNDGSKWLVLGKDEAGDPVVLENSDNWLRLKFNSSDIQATLEPGKTYQCEVIGYRVRLLSWYENILKIREVQD